MSTRAIQDPMQLLGFRDPVTDVVLSGGSVEFYGAGGSVAKNAWEDKDKLVAITSVTLDSAGQAQVYLDGVYKFIVKNAAGTTKRTLDNLKFQARNTSTVTKTADYQATADDDYILVDTDSGAVTITLAAVAGVVAPITIKNTGSSGNAVTVDGSGSETIDSAATQSLTDGASQQYVTDNVQWYGAGVTSGTTLTTSSVHPTPRDNGDGTFTITGISDGTVNLKVKVLDIGDWNMDATAFVNVAHGLTDSTIRTISVMIRPNTPSGPPTNLDFGLTPNGSIDGGAPGFVQLTRLGSGSYDSTDYNSTSYNRGWVTIWYTI